MQGFWRRFIGNPRVALSLIWLAFIVTVAAAAPLLAPGSAFVIVSKPFSPPFGEFLLGTDSLGRSLLAGLIHGARTSLLIAIIATLAAVAFGTLIGSLAGFYGGIIDDVLMRVSEFFQTIPSFIFAIVLVAILAPSAESLVIAIATVSWPPIARVVRGEVLTIKAREFVQAAIVAGQRDMAILVSQVLPNALSPLIVTGSILWWTPLTYLGAVPTWLRDSMSVIKDTGPATFSPNGRQLAFVAQNTKLQLWTLATSESKSLSIGPNYATVAAAPAWQP